MRKLQTYHRHQTVFEVVMDQDDELRAMRLCHRTLMQLRPEARRRAVRYLVDRHVTSTEPEPFPNPDKAENPLAQLDRDVRRIAGPDIQDVEHGAPPAGVSAAAAVAAVGIARASDKTLAEVMGEGILSERSGS